jgi:hypothetical protein
VSEVKIHSHFIPKDQCFLFESSWKRPKCKISSNTKEDYVLGFAPQKARRRHETSPIPAYNRVNQIKEHPEIFSPL